MNKPGNDKKIGFECMIYGCMIRPFHMSQQSFQPSVKHGEAVDQYVPNVPAVACRSTATIQWHNKWPARLAQMPWNLMDPIMSYDTSSTHVALVNRPAKWGAKGWRKLKENKTHQQLLSPQTKWNTRPSGQDHSRLSTIELAAQRTRLNLNFERPKTFF